MCCVIIRCRARAELDSPAERSPCIADCRGRGNGGTGGRSGNVRAAEPLAGHAHDQRVQVAVRKYAYSIMPSVCRFTACTGLKSGGVASILREDAGGVADLIFSMLYNPWRAIIQLIGSLTVLAFVDWRLLLGLIALLPTVWLTHRTWNRRIRPIFRDIRSTRQNIDSHATEAFGGMRVVRSFSRQQSEAATFTRSGHLMARQEIFAWWWMRESTWRGRC